MYGILPTIVDTNHTSHYSTASRIINTNGSPNEVYVIGLYSQSSQVLAAVRKYIQLKKVDFRRKVAVLGRNFSHLFEILLFDY